MLTTRGSSTLKVRTASAGSTPAISKSTGSAPAATPRPTRPGCRALSQATSSATSAVARSGSNSGAGGCPANPAFLQNERRHLKRLRHVAREPAVMLTGHDPVEAAAKGNARLIAQFVHDCFGFELVVRVQTNRDRAASEGRCRQAVRHFGLCSTPNLHRSMLRQASDGVLGERATSRWVMTKSLITLVRAEWFGPQDV